MCTSDTTLIRYTNISLTLQSTLSDDHFAAQDVVFEACGEPIIATAVDGFNASVFAYGQTGAGKSYSMMGGEGEQRGLIPRICERLFEHVEKAAEGSEDASPATAAETDGMLASVCCAAAS